MSSKHTPRPTIYLATAHATSALHLVCLIQWEFYGFMQLDLLSQHQEQVKRIVGPILSFTQFPSFQLLGFESDAPAGIACLLTGYLVGFAIGYFAGPQVIQLKATSFIWWISVVIVATDLGCICVLTDHPLQSFLAYLLALVWLVPVTLITAIVLWVSRRRTSTAPNETDN